jgi:hypothetical protein
MTKFDLIKKMLNGSTTMPMGTNMGTPVGPNAKVHYHNGVACNHDHSHDHSYNHGHENHVHDDHNHHHHHEDGSCCNHDHSKD